MRKKQTLKDTFLRNLLKAGIGRIEREPSGPISDDISGVLRVIAPLGWLDKFHQTADPRTREVMLTCFLLGRDTQKVQLGEKFFLNAQIGWKQRQKGKDAAQARWGTLEERRRKAIDFKPEFDKLTSGLRPMSKRSALRILACKHKCHPATLYRLLKLLNPPKKKL